MTPTAVETGVVLVALVLFVLSGGFALCRKVFKTWKMGDACLRCSTSMNAVGAVLL